MDDPLLGAPPKWWWSLDKMPQAKKKAPYSIYMCNGEKFGTAAFCEVSLDGVSPIELFQRAIPALHEAIQNQEDERKKERPAKPKRRVG